MAEPYQFPATGTPMKMYRLLRDTLYHTAGTIVALSPDQVGPNHELVTMEHPGDDAIAALTERVAVLESKIALLEGPQPPADDIPEPVTLAEVPVSGDTNQ